MIMDKRIIARAVLELISSRSFEEWYEKEFLEYIEGEEDMTKEDMIKFLMENINLKENA